MNKQHKVTIMRNDKVLIFTRVLYVIFAIGTLISLFIAYNDIDSDIAYKFVIGYLFLTFFFIIYIPFITIINLRKLKWIVIRKCFYKFIILFVSFSILYYLLDYILRRDNISLYRELSHALGLAFGLAFIDITFLKKNQN